MSNQTENTSNEKQNNHITLKAMSGIESQRQNQQALTIFAARLKGDLILPEDSDYESRSSDLEWHL